jgi:putative membrane protein
VRSPRILALIVVVAFVTGVAGTPAAAHVAESGAVSSMRRWNTDAWLWLALLAAGGLYLNGIRRLWRQASVGAGIRRWQAGAFAGGWIALVLATISPLDALGAELFSAHMVQHELMMLVAAPLLVLGRPYAPMIWGLPRGLRPWIGRAVAAPRLRRVALALGTPTAAGAIHAVLLWGWHAPALFQAARERRWVHDLQHVGFFGSALLFWWAIFRAGSVREHVGAALLWLFTTLLHTSVLGALLAFSGRAWYPGYEASAPAWGLTALQDQQLGGLIMWVPGGLVYLVVGLALLAPVLSMAERPR